MEIAQNKTNSFKKYRKTQIQWEHIPRAKEPDKNLAEKAIKIISVTVPKINAQGYAIYTHAYLSKITKCKQDQNTNLLKQIYHVFNVNAHKSIVIDGKRYRNVYVIKAHENTFKILDNPKVFFSEENNKISCNQSSCEDKDKNACKDVEKKEKIDSEAEKIRSSNSCTLYSNSNTNSFNNRSISNFKKDDLSKKILKLSDFTDLNEKDCETLRNLSGRSFSSNAIKEIIKDMARRVSDVYFKYKSGFIAYMTQVLKNEMRDEVKTSNTNFRIKANLTDEDKKVIEIERYLTEVENIREVSQEVHLKKKLVGVLKPLTAYNLLRNYRYIKVTGSISQIALREHVELTELEKNVVLNQVKATHDKVEKSGTFLWIKEVEFIMPPKRETETKKNENKDKKPEVAPRIGIWGDIRTTIAKYLSYGSSNGDVLDACWFSKLEAEIDGLTKQITLKAPSKFIKDWVFREYENVIDEAAMRHGLIFKGIYTEEKPKWIN